MLTLNILLLFFIMSFSLRSTDASHSHNWTYIKFSQSWPATVCRLYVESNSSNTCNFPKTPGSWSIHGIWPSRPGSKGPGHCNKTWLFDPQEIKPIQSKLEQGWINVKNGTSYYSLWAHEWNKHGTCAASLKPMRSQIKFFSQGLHWLKKFNMAKILSDSKILPSDTKTYSHNDFYKAVKSKLGFAPDMKCMQDIPSGKQFLWELQICFSKSLEMIDCPPDSVGMFFINNVKFIHTCNDTVIYSTAQPPSKTWTKWVHARD